MTQQQAGSSRERERMDESLSSLMDGEAGDLELQRLLKAASTDSALRATWSRYQLVSAVIRQQQVDAVPSLTLADRIFAELDMGVNQQAGVAPVPARHVRSVWAGLAVAASVALAVVVGVQWQQQHAGDRLIAQSSPAVAAPMAEVAAVAPPASVVLAAADQSVSGKPVAGALQQGQTTVNPQFERYMRYHLERVSLDPNRGMVPMATTAVERER